MRNILIKCRFCGTNYKGYQVQVAPNTICNVLQKAIEKVFLTRYDIKGCSRTDSRVHANEYFFNFKTEKSEEKIPCRIIPRALNTYLPKDIVIHSAVNVDENFHARYNCIGKEYLYIIHNQKLRDPFFENRTLQYSFNIDEKLLNIASKEFIGKHDFSAFCGKHSDIEEKSRTILDFSVERKNDDVYFKVSGDGFLYNMVRIMTGTLLKINEGFLKKEDIKDIILSKDRRKAGVTVIPDGLYLNRVFYNNEILEKINNAVVY